MFNDPSAFPAFALEFCREILVSGIYFACWFVSPLQTTSGTLIIFKHSFDEVMNLFVHSTPSSQCIWFMAFLCGDMLNCMKQNVEQYGAGCYAMLEKYVANRKDMLKNGEKYASK